MMHIALQDCDTFLTMCVMGIGICKSVGFQFFVFLNIFIFIFYLCLITCHHECIYYFQNLSRHLGYIYFFQNCTCNGNCPKSYDTSYSIHVMGIDLKSCNPSHSVLVMDIAYLLFLSFFFFFEL